MDYGGKDLDDLEAVVNGLKALPYVDGSRIGIWGSSYGGLLSVYALLKRPGMFAAGVAGAPAVDPHAFGPDDVAITRSPATHPDAFERGSALRLGEDSARSPADHPRPDGRRGAVPHHDGAGGAADAARARTSTSPRHRRPRTPGARASTTRCTSTASWSSTSIDTCGAWHDRAEIAAVLANMAETAANSALSCQAPTEEMTRDARSSNRPSVRGDRRNRASRPRPSIAPPMA